MTIDKILKHYDLRSTGCRKSILKALLSTQSAMTENDLKSSINDLFDRVTIYRTLKTFEEVGVIHRIVLNDNSVKYALTDSQHQQDHIHSHFHCSQCDKVFCMPHCVDITTNLPKGYISENISVIINGVCGSCN